MHAVSLAFSIFDYVVIAVLVFGCLFGLARGFFRELFVFIVWLLAYGLAGIFADPFSSYVSTYIDDAKIAYLLTFMLIFFVVWLLGSVIHLLISIFSKSVGVPFISRMLGGIIGVAQGVLVAILVMFVISNIPNVKEKWFDQSVSVHVAQPLLTWMKTTLISQQ